MEEGNNQELTRDEKSNLNNEGALEQKQSNEFVEIKESAQNIKEIPDKIRIPFFGLDNSGKTTIIKKLLGEDLTNIKPTLGFNISTVTGEGQEISYCDICGYSQGRDYWQHYLSENEQGVIYVIDAIDEERLDEAILSLQTLLSYPELDNVPLLVLCNKLDSKHPETIVEDIQAKIVPSLEGRVFCFQGCSGINGMKVAEGIQWVIMNFKEEKPLIKDTEKQKEEQEKQ